MCDKILNHVTTMIQNAVRHRATTDDLAEIHAQLRELQERLRTLEERLVKAVTAFYDPTK